MFIETESNTFTFAFDTIFAQKKHYHYVYMSIGSKYNQQDVFFQAPGFDLAKRVDTNTSMQMVPVFLRGKPADRNILVISVDTYRNSTESQMNKRQIQSVLDKNMDCIMVNMFCNNENLCELCTKLLSKVVLHNIPESSCIICNYVKFMNMPNETERISETMIPVAIQSVLNKREFVKYKMCYAEWFGYKYSLYNCIYKVLPTKTDLYLYKRIHELDAYLTHTMPMSLQIRDIKLHTLMENSYDISSYHVDEDADVIAPSLRQIYCLN